MTEITLRIISTPAWANRIPASSWNTGYGYFQDGELKLPVLDPATLEVAVAQSSAVWSCVAKCMTKEGKPAYFAFSTLGFIAMWNSVDQAGDVQGGPMKISLYNGVKDAILYRHPAMMPMEIEYNHTTGKFERSMIYSVSELESL